MRFANNGILKGVFILSLSGAIAQIIPFLVQPWLRGYFSPDIFGELELIVKTGSLVTIFFSLNLEVIMYSKSKGIPQLRFLREIFSYALNKYLWSVIWLVCISLLYFFDSKSPWLYSIIALVLAFSLMGLRVMTVFNVANSKYHFAGFGRIIRRVFELAFYGLAIYLGSSIIFYLSEMIGVLIAFCVVFFCFNKLRLFSIFMPKVEFFKKNEEFIKYNPPSTFIGILSDSLVFFIIAYFFTVKDVGIFDLGFKMSILPVGFATSNLSPVLLQKMGEAKSSAKNYLKVLMIFVGVLMVLGVTYYYISNEAISYFWDDYYDIEWELSKEIALKFIPLGAIMLIMSPLGQILLINEDYKLDAIWKILKLTGNFIVLLFIVADLSVFVGIYTKIFIGIYICYLGLILFSIKRFYRENFTV